MIRGSKMILRKSVLNAEWFDFNEKVKYLIRPYPFHLLEVTPEGKVKNTFEAFDHALLDWKGYENEDGTVAECSTENKRLVFDFRLMEAGFIFDKATEKVRKFNEEVKNLETSQPT